MPPHAVLQREQLDSERQKLRSEFEQLVASQQERASEWEAAAKQEETAMSKRKQVGGAGARLAWQCLLLLGA